MSSQELGDIGSNNLKKLQRLKTKVDRQHTLDLEATRIDRVAKFIDAKYESILLSDKTFPEVASVLRNQRRAGKDVLDQKYYRDCADEIISRRLFTENSEGRLSLKSIYDEEI